MKTLSLTTAFRFYQPHLLVILSLFLSASCSRSDPVEDRPIARVEEESLTLHDLNQETEYNYFSFGETAERWIDEQVLLHHAERTRIVDHQSLLAELKEHEYQLIAHMLLDSLLDRHIQIDQEQLREYYANNLQEYRITEDAALVTHIGFRRYEEAQSTLEMLNNSATSQDSILNHFNYDYQLVHRSRIIPALGEEIFQAEENQFNGPIKTEFGYHVFMVERFFRAGETTPFILVRRQIYEKLFQMKLPLARSAILDSLREVLDVEVYND